MAHEMNMMGKMLKWSRSIAVIGSMIGASASAQQYVAPGMMAIDGIPVVCGPALTILSGSQIGGVARAFPGQILLNWPVFMQMPTGVKLFIYAHECGHLLHGLNEDIADEFAIRLGVAQGWINPMVMQQICQSVYFSPGDWTHAPGPLRCQRMLGYLGS